MIRARALLAITAVAVASGSAAAAAEGPGFSAYGALTPFDSPKTAPNIEGPARAGRVAAVRKCSDVSGRYRQTTWGVREVTVYRVCMFQQGQIE
jgi:hypothetical protein